MSSTTLSALTVPLLVCRAVLYPESRTRRFRYQHDDIYTNIVNILIAINPYKHIDIYGKDEVAKYSGALSLVPAFMQPTTHASQVSAQIPPASLRRMCFPSARLLTVTWFCRT